MISTFSQVRTRALALLDDPNQQTYKDAIVLEGLGEAMDALYSAFLLFQIPRVKVVQTYILPANTTSVSPATAGIADFGELIHLEERLSGSTERFTHVWETNDLPQRDASDRLREFEWRSDSFYFVGATTDRELRFAYFSTTEQPTDFTGSTGVDGAKTFLAKYTAAVIAPRKGENELGAMYLQQAVGPRYDAGIIGGELLRMCQPMVRAEERVQIAPRPFNAAGRMRLRRAVPYVAAQAGTTGGTAAPVQYSSALGTLTGAIDGVNAQFLFPHVVTGARVYRNGLLMTAGVDYTLSANAITFLPGQIPIPTDIVTAEGWS